MPFKDSRRRAALQASLARAKQRKKAKEDAMDQSGSDSNDSALLEPPSKSARGSEVDAAVAHLNPDLAVASVNLYQFYNVYFQLMSTAMVIMTASLALVFARCLATISNGERAATKTNEVKCSPASVCFFHATWMNSSQTFTLDNLVPM
jgi:hypothetical protein